MQNWLNVIIRKCQNGKIYNNVIDWGKIRSEPEYKATFKFNIYHRNIVGKSRIYIYKSCQATDSEHVHKITLDKTKQKRKQMICFCVKFSKLKEQIMSSKLRIVAFSLGSVNTRALIKIV